MSDSIEEKLNYIGLDLENIPEFLKEFKPLEFRPSKILEDNKHLVYKFIPIDKIQIMITPKNRLDDIEEKYAKAVPLFAYLNKQDEQEKERFSNFLTMLNKVTIEDIKAAEDEQKKLTKSIPFEVKYNKSYAWQIYYSDSTNQYFMMAPSEEADLDKLFLLLKMQIKLNSKKAKDIPKIFAPVNCVDYSEKILKKSEIKEIENYLWLFTKDWTNIYEVFDADNKMTLQIVGQTNVYENLKSKYRIKLTSKEEANTFYKFIKALFVMQTELSMHYKFTTKINSESELEFFYNKTKIKYENLPDFIEKEYTGLIKKDERNKKEIEKKNKELKKLKQIAKDKESIYLEKQKQIAMYLECKKTFMGKMKYFFKSNKKMKLKNGESFNRKNREKSIETDTVEDTEIDDITVNLENKPYYTIEDLVTLYYKADKTSKDLSNINMDIEALNYKIENLTLKVKNAILYIAEINQHKKSIFEFWKFANKDEVQALEVGNSKEEKKKIKKTFKYDFDFADMSEQMDKTERIKLSKDEQDSLFIATTNVIDVINNINYAKDSLDSLKQEQEDNLKIYNINDFDIFGSVQDNREKNKNLGNKKHRETKKDKFKILGITKDTIVEDYTNKITNIQNYLKESFKKIKSKYNMSIYVSAESDEILNNQFYKFYINIEDALKNSNSEKEVKIYKLNIKEDMPVLYCTNIVFYDNYYKTLPEGMNVEETVLIKTDMFEYEEVAKEEFKTNMYLDENLENPIVRKITVYEYDLQMK